MDKKNRCIMAAIEGDLNALKYLHENKMETDWETFIDQAAVCNRLDSVIWLHKNRPEKSKKALVYAAYAGNLDVVEFLYENDPETSYVQEAEAILRAEKSGHVNVVKYLKEKVKEKNAQEA